MVNQTPHCRFDLLRADTNVQECCSTCIKRTAGNERMDDRLTCGRNVPGSTRQTNALLFYSLGNEVDKRRSRTAPLIYKSIVIGSTDELAPTDLLIILDCLRVGTKHLIHHVKGQHRLLILFQCIVPPTVLELLEKSREPNWSQCSSQHLHPCCPHLAGAVHINIHHLQSPQPSRIQDSSHAYGAPYSGKHESALHLLSPSRYTSTLVHASLVCHRTFDRLCFISNSYGVKYIIP